MVNPARMNGQPTIRDLRLAVKRVLELVALYPDRSQLYQEYPELTEEDITPTFTRGRRRKRGTLPPAVLLDENKLHQDSCGLRVMIMDGGAGFQEIICCGHSLKLNAMKEFKYGEDQRGGEEQVETGPSGNA